MNMLITCLAECLIDFIPIPSEGENVNFHISSGGAILNVAVGLARLGNQTAFAGKVANDFFGRYLRSRMESEGIDTRFLSYTSGAKSTLAFAMMTESGPAFTFYGDGAADTLLTMADLPQMLFAETRIMHFGSTSLLRGTTPETILQAAEFVKGRVLLSFDPNIRPDLIQDESHYRLLLQRAFALADVVKMSDVDLAWIAPGLSCEQAIQNLLTQGAQLVVITRGGQGVIAGLANAPEVLTEVPAFPVDVVDTVGAGDSFCAGLLSQLAQREGPVDHLLALSNQELRAMLYFASGVSALNCMKAGANPPRRAEVERFLLQSQAMQA
jgi:Sugar kinases, ribokinase family